MRNLFRLKKENEGIKDRIIRDIENLFEQQEEDYHKPVRVGNFIGTIMSNMKENVAIKNRIIRDIKNLFEQEEDYNKPLREVNFYRKSYIKCEINGDKNQTLSIKEYLDEVKPHIQLTKAINILRFMINYQRR